MRFVVLNVVMVIMAFAVLGGISSASAQTSANAPAAPDVVPALESPPTLDAAPEEPQTLEQPDDLGGLVQGDSAPDASKGKSKKQNEQAPSAASFLQEAGIDLEGDADADAKNKADAAGLDLQDLQADAKPPEQDPEKVKAEENIKLRKEAFGQASSSLMPLKPAEIRKILEIYDSNAQAVETPIYPNPEPMSSFKTISLSPGTKPFIVRTAIGNVTTLSIVDVTGRPWPIMDMTWAGDFQIEQPEKGGHMIRITPMTEFARGNVSMRLVGLNPPVIFSMTAERNAVDVRLDIQIPEVGPMGVLPPVSTPVSTRAGDEQLTSVLLGVAGRTGDAKTLTVDGVDGRTTVYDLGGMMYIRTPYTMLSPAWAKSVQSADGTKVYALNFTPVVLLSDKGKLLRAYISREEHIDDQF